MIDDKQFVLSKIKLKKDGWLSITLSNRYVLNYHYGLRVETNSDCSAVLLGHAWTVEDNKSTPYDIIKTYNSKTSIETVINDEKRWCGRYALIVADYMFTDAMGLLGVFYNGSGVASSSIRLLCEFCGMPISYPSNVKKGNPCFVPGMYTGYDNTYRLLPSQILNLNTLSYETRLLLPDGIKGKGTHGNVHDFIDIYTQSLINMKEHFQGYHVAFALSGGKDCRMVLSILERTGINYFAFTAEHGDICDGDVYLPKRIAKALKCPYQFIKRRKEEYSQKRYDDFRTHTGGYSVDEDWNFYAYGQYAKLPPSTLILRGGVLEMASLYYQSHFCPDGRFDIRKIFCDMDTKPDYDKAINEYMEYVYSDKINQKSGINIFDRVCWELLGGCWLSSVEQSFDMMENIVSVQSCNCRLFMSYLLGFDDGRRLTKGHEVEITAKACPILGAIPYADDDFKKFYPFFPKLKKRIANKLFFIRQKFE